MHWQYFSVPLMKLKITSLLHRKICSGGTSDWGILDSKTCNGQCSGKL